MLFPIFFIMHIQCYVKTKYSLLLYRNRIKPFYKSNLCRISLTQNTLQLRRRDPLRSWQITHFAILFQKIKFSFPVTAHDKKIDLVVLGIGGFLFPIVFWDY